MSDSESEPVLVFVRLRPESLASEPSSAEVSKRSLSLNNINSFTVNSTIDRCIHIIDDKTLRYSPPDAANGTRKGVPAVDDKIYTYDGVLDDQTSQDAVYERVRSNVKATVRGYNTTIFAYGSTGSGKSYTMTGTTANPGIIPRAISEVFSFIETTASADKDVYFYVRISYVELYNNNFRNLLEFASKDLAPKDREEGLDSMGQGMKGRTKIEVRESQTAGVFLSGPNLRIPVTTAQEAFQLISKGNKSRSVGSTQCNDVSSRSHAVLTIHVESRVASMKEGGPPELRLGKMHLVDLAGSERVAMSGAEGDTLTETQSINLSLSAIGDVLSALSRNATILGQQSSGKSPLKGQGWSSSATLVPVPYRNSKLTHLLKDSLGGNSKTIMITTVRTTAEYAQLTAASLMYSSRAKKIKNRSLINHDVVGDTGIFKVTTEIERLRSRLEERTKEFDRLRQLHLQDSRENSVLKSRLQELQLANDFEKRELEEQMSQVIHSQAGQLALQKDRIVSLQHALEAELSQSLNKIAEQEKEIKWLQQALDESTSAGESSTNSSQEVDKLVRELNEWRTLAQNSQGDLALALQRAEDVKRTSEEQCLQIERQVRQIDELGQVRDDLAATLSQVESEVQYYKDSVSSLEAKYNALEEMQQLSAEELRRSELRQAEAMANAAAALSAQESINHSLQAKEASMAVENIQLKQRLEVLLTTLEKEATSAIDSATNKASISEASQNRLIEENRSLKLYLDKAKVEIDTLNSLRTEERARSDEEIKKLRKETEKYGVASSNLEKQLNIQVKANTELIAELSPLREAAASRNGSFSADLEKITEEIQEIQVANKIEIQKEKEKLRAEKEAFYRIYAEELELTKAESDKQLQQRDVAITTLNGQIGVLQIEVESLRVAISLESAKLSSCSQERDAICTSYEEQLRVLRAEIDERVDEALTTQKAKYKLLIKEKVSLLEQDHAEVMRLKIEEIHKKHTLEIDNLRRSLDESENRRTIELSQAREESTSAMSVLKQALQQVHERKLKESLEHANSVHEQFQIELAKREKDLKELIEELGGEALRKSCESCGFAETLRKLHSFLRKAMETMNATCKSKDATIFELEGVIKSHADSRIDLEKQLEIANSESTRDLLISECRLQLESQHKQALDIQSKWFETKLEELSDADNTRLNIAVASIENLEKENRQLSSSCKRLEAELARIKDQYEHDVFDRVQFKEDALQLLERNENLIRSSMQVKIDEKEKLYSSTLENLHTTYQTKLMELETKISELSSSSSATISDLERQIKLEKQMSAKKFSQATIDKIRDDYNITLNRLISQNILESGSVSEELVDTKKLLHKVVTDYQELSTLAVTLDDTFDDRLQEGLRAALSHSSQLEKQLAEKEESMKQLETLLEQHCQEKASVDKALDALLREKDAGEALAEELAQVRIALNLKEEELQGACDSIREKDTSISALRYSAERSLGESRLKEELSRQLSTSVQELQARCFHYENELRRLNSLDEIRVKGKELESPQDSISRLLSDDTGLVIEDDIHSQYRKELEINANYWKDALRKKEEEVKSRIQDLTAIYEEKLREKQRNHEIEVRLSEKKSEEFLSRHVERAENELKDRIRSEASVWNSKLNEQQLRNEALNQENSELKVLLNNGTAEQNRQTTEASRATSALEMKEADNQRLRERISELEARYDQLLTQMRENLKGRDDMISLLKQQLQHETETSTHASKTMASEVEAFKYVIEELRKELAVANDRERRLSESHSATLTEISSAVTMSSDVKDRQQQIIFDQKIQAMERNFEFKFQSIKEEYENRLNDTQSLLEQTEEILQASQKRADAFKTELQNSQNNSTDVSSLLFALSESENKINIIDAAYKKEKEELLSKISGMESNFHNALAERIDYSTQLYKNEISKLRDEMIAKEEEMTRSLSLMKVDAADAESQAQELIAILRQELTMAKDVIENTLKDQELITTQKMKDDHEIALNSLQEAFAKKEKELSDLKNASDLERNYLYNQLDDGKDQHLREISEVKEKLRKEILTLESALKVATSKRAKLEDSLRCSRFEAAAADENYRLALDKVRQEYEQQLMDDKEQHMLAIDKLHREIAEMKTHLALESEAYRSKCERLEAELREKEKIWETEQQSMQQQLSNKSVNILDQSKILLLEAETEHLSKLEAVHHQLREVEARHAIRVTALEDHVTELSSSKDNLLLAIQLKDLTLEDAKAEVEELRRELLLLRPRKEVYESPKGIDRKRPSASFSSTLKVVQEDRGSSEQDSDLSPHSLKNLTESPGVRYQTFPGRRRSAADFDKRDTYQDDLIQQQRRGSVPVASYEVDIERTFSDFSTDSKNSSRNRPPGMPQSPMRQRHGPQSLSDVNYHRVDAATTRNRKSQVNTPSASGPGSDAETVNSESSAGKSQLRAVHSTISSPTDQLISAIIDGDSVSLLSIVRSKGSDFKSGYWKVLAPSILPAHRAISGLHFHGSEKLLISTLSVLIQLGANVNDADHNGATVLHRVLHVCTSKSVSPILELLLVQGADPNLANKDGETPLHFECKRLRTASPEVIRLLINSGANVNQKVRILGSKISSSSISALSLLLLNADNSVSETNVLQSRPFKDHSSLKGRKVWLRSLEALMKGGAKWEPSIIFQNGMSQLSFLYALFPPPSSDVDLYIRIIGEAIDAGFDLQKEDSAGRSSLFVLCDRMAATPLSDCQEVVRIMNGIIAYYGNKGYGSADRQGRSLLDIEDAVSKSCFSACKKELAEAILKASPKYPNKSDMSLVFSREKLK